MQMADHLEKLHIENIWHAMGLKHLKTCKTEFLVTRKFIRSSRNMIDSIKIIYLSGQMLNMFDNYSAVWA